MVAKNHYEIIATDDKPNAMKLASIAEVRTDGAARAEGKFICIMPSRDRGRQ